MDKKTIDEICNYIKENPNCITEYCDQENFIIYKPVKKLIISDNLDYDWDVNDEGEGYIPNIALIFHACAKKRIDISKITIKSN